MSQELLGKMGITHVKVCVLIRSPTQCSIVVVSCLLSTHTHTGHSAVRATRYREDTDSSHHRQDPRVKTGRQKHLVILSKIVVHFSEIWGVGVKNF